MFHFLMIVYFSQHSVTESLRGAVQTRDCADLESALQQSASCPPGSIDVLALSAQASMLLSELKTSGQHALDALNDADGTRSLPKLNAALALVSDFLFSISFPHEYSE
jgi:hypothetical protein